MVESHFLSLQSIYLLWIESHPRSQYERVVLLMILWLDGSLWMLLARSHRAFFSVKPNASFGLIWSFSCSSQRFHIRRIIYDYAKPQKLARLDRNSLQLLWTFHLVDECTQVYGKFSNLNMAVVHASELAKIWFGPFSLFARIGALSQPHTSCHDAKIVDWWIGFTQISHPTLILKWGNKGRGRPMNWNVRGKFHFGCKIAPNSTSAKPKQGIETRKSLAWRIMIRTQAIIWCVLWAIFGRLEFLCTL